MQETSTDSILPFRQAAAGDEPHVHSHWERITELERAYETPSGVNFVVSVEGRPREDGTWTGRLVFVGRGDVRVTPDEITQPSRDALTWWASSIEPEFLDGAFGRASAEAAS